MLIKIKQRVIHFIQFKIRYNDLIGNLYEQKFRFGYDNYVLKGYNRNNSSYQPKLIKESQEISDFNNNIKYFKLWGVKKYMKSLIIYGSQYGQQNVMLKIC